MQIKRLFITITVLFSLLVPNFTQAQQLEHPIVRLIYFLPRDRQAEPAIDAKIDRVIKQVQQHYTDEMARLGYGKTFKLEIGANGKVVVHHVKGEFNDAHYRENTFGKISEEISKRYDTSKDVYFVAANTAEGFEAGVPGRELVCGLGGHFTLVRSFDECFTTDYGFLVAAHELGHTFGLQHDFSNDTYLMSYGGGTNLSACDAEWLDVHRAFDPNRPTANEQPTFEMLSVSLAAPPNAIRFRFRVSDPDGLHQARLHTRTLTGPGAGFPEMVSCQRLDGQSNTTAELVTTYLGVENKSVSLHIIDMNGNFRRSEEFPVNIASVLPRARGVSIPDVNLAAAIRREIGSSITTHTILNLTRLDARNRGITDLTGLQHAHNLRELNLGYKYIDREEINSNAISDFSPIAELTRLTQLNLSHCGLSDASFVSGLTQLTWLDLGNNNISDISPLAELKQLNQLHLWNNNISDVSPLAELKQLTWLQINNNSISDVSPLAKLTQLRGLGLGSNTISDISPLANLTQLTDLSLWDNTISDISPLANLTQLTSLRLSNNPLSDVSALSKLTQLTQLVLGNNAIQDVSPLVNLNLSGTQWDNTGLYLWGNPLSYASINTHIPAMQAKGIEVKFDNRAYRALVKVSGDGQEATVGETLPRPFIVEVRDERGKPMQGAAVTFADTVGDGRLSATTATTNAKGRTRTTLTLGQTPGKYTVRVSATGIQASMIFTSTATAPPMYWVDKNSGTLHRSIGSSVENLVPSIRNATSLAVDVGNNNLYWTEQTSNTTGRIRRANLDGSNVQLIKNLTSVPLGIAMEPANRRIYITNSWGKVQRLNVDGSNFKPNLITGLDTPQALSVDTIGGKLYWIEKTGDSTGKIQRANLDGSHVQLVKSFTSALGGLAIDPVNSKLYITNARGKVQRLNVDGSNFEPNLITGLDSPEGIAVDVAGGTLYWTEAGSIWRASLNGENIQDVAADLGTPVSIVLGVTPVGPTIPAAPEVRTVLPEATGLLPNYPNPFNPETWIPYQLATPAEVTLRIYAVNGALVRTLALGHQTAGMYQSKSHTAYWDGRNEQGEGVASGIYFYTITAGDFTATRKMLIRK